MKKKLLLLSCFIFPATLLLAQAPPSVTLPPPDAAQLQRFIDYPVEHYTGLPKINIPLYEIVSGDLVLPISLSYHASGIKVEDAAGITGAGWSLSTGGSVSRTIKDKADDQYTSFKDHVPSMLEAELNLLDVEPDIFYYSLNKSSGKFMFEARRRNEAMAAPTFFPRNNVRYSAVQSSNNNGIDEIFLTDEDGSQYKFGDRNSLSTESSEGPLNRRYKNTWKVKQILPKSRNVNDAINFTYIPGKQIATLHRFGHLSILDSVQVNPYSHHLLILSGEYSNHQSMPLGTSYEPLGPSVLGAHSYVSKPYPYNMEEWSSGNHFSYSSVNLSEVNFKNGKVVYTYNHTNDLLNKIEVFNGHNKAIKTINFFYSKFSSAASAKARLDSISISNNGESLKHRFEYNGDMYSTIYPLAQDYWGYPNGAETNTDLVPAFEVKFINYITNSGSVHYDSLVVGTSNRNADVNYAQACVLKKIYYPTGGYSVFEYGLNKFYDAEKQQVISGGGLRVERINNYDGSGGYLSKVYEYGQNGNGAGTAKLVPELKNYLTEQMLYYTMVHDIYDGYQPASPPLIIRKRIVSSNPNKSLYFSDGSAVYYSHVTERIVDENDVSIGKTSYEYSLPPEDFYNVFDHNFILNSNQTLYAFYMNSSHPDLKPVLRNKTVFKSIGNTLLPINLASYQYGTTTSGTVSAYPVYRWLFYNLGLGLSDLDEEPAEIIVGKYSLGSTILYNTTHRLSEESNKEYVYNHLNQLTDSIESGSSYWYGSALHTFPTQIHSYDSKSDERIRRLKYPLDYDTSTSLDSLSAGLMTLNLTNSISEPVEEIELVNDLVVSAGLKTYKPDLPLVDKYFRLDKTVAENTFVASAVDNGELVMDPGYLEKFQVDAYNSEGDILQLHQDKGPHVSYKWGYSDHYPIVEVKNAKEEEFLYEDFEGNGSIAASPGAASQTGLKGFNGTLNLGNHFNPSLNGKKYLLSYYKLTDGQWEYVEVDYTGQSISGTIDNIRIHPTDAEMITYTYEPLVGMKSMTDASGKTVYYEYDNLQRLKFIKDMDGKILKKYDYHYKP